MSEVGWGRLLLDLFEQAGHRAVVVADLLGVALPLHRLDDLNAGVLVLVYLVHADVTLGHHDHPVLAPVGRPGWWLGWRRHPVAGSGRRTRRARTERER
ncbi:hypothetical protein BRD00_00740 [Halobacteriales archaeon QS_8_69_26]|nr:MAG: hypothetical protein BRD00_00740 [Halobacteriales archaeon QS_8_69_26]